MTNGQAIDGVGDTRIVIRGAAGEPGTQSRRPSHARHTQRLWVARLRRGPPGPGSAARPRNDQGEDGAVAANTVDPSSEPCRHLWDRAQSLSDKDAFLGQRYDRRVRPDPDDPHFSLSFGGEAFFLVGMHPGASRIYLTTGDPIYSNRSNVLLRIVEDTVGRHDFLLTPCSADTFRIIYGDAHPHRGCFGNLAAALAPYGIVPDRIPVAFNVFMNVTIDGETGELKVEPPLSRPGDHVTFEAETDLIVGLTACSALQSNNNAFKPIRYEIRPARGAAPPSP